MLLSELQSLNVNDKHHWLETPEGKVQLRHWLSDGLSLIKISKLMQIHDTTLHKWCERNPDLSEISGRPFVEAGSKLIMEDLSRPKAYRLISYVNPNGKVLSEYETPEDAWNDWRIHLLLRTVSNYEKEKYFQSYLKSIAQKGRYPLSNAVHVVYCSLNPKGIIRYHLPRN